MTSRYERRLHKKEARKEEVVAERSRFAKRTRNKRIINYAVVALLLVGVGYGLYQWLAPEASEHDTLARCITTNGGIMYGTNWCPHCQEQKRLFGDSFRYITFIDCDVSAVACSAANVQSFPTWHFARGVSVTGVQQLADLAKRAGCQVE